MKLYSFITALFFRFFNLSSCTTVEDKKSYAYIRKLFSNVKLQNLNNLAERNISEMLLDNKFNVQLIEENDLKIQYTRFKAFYDLSLDLVSCKLRDFLYERLKLCDFLLYGICW